MALPHLAETKENESADEGLVRRGGPGAPVRSVAGKDRVQSIVFSQAADGSVDAAHEQPRQRPTATGTERDTVGKLLRSPLPTTHSGSWYLEDNSVDGDGFSASSADDDAATSAADHASYVVAGEGGAPAAEDSCGDEGKPSQWSPAWAAHSLERHPADETRRRRGPAKSVDSTARARSVTVMAGVAARESGGPRHSHGSEADARFDSDNLSRLAEQRALWRAAFEHRRLGGTPPRSPAGSPPVTSARGGIDSISTPPQVPQRKLPSRSPMREEYARESSGAAASEVSQSPRGKDLHSACTRGDLQAVHQLAHTPGALLWRHPVSGQTALHGAAAHGHKGCAEALLVAANRCAAEVLLQRDSHGRLPLHVAAELGHEGVCEVLVNAGALPQDTYYRGKGSEDAVAAARRAGYPLLAERLVSLMKISWRETHNRVWAGRPSGSSDAK